jgi:hypothetical protein
MVVTDDLCPSKEVAHLFACNHDSSGIFNFASVVPVFPQEFAVQRFELSSITLKLDVGQFEFSPDSDAVHTLAHRDVYISLGNRSVVSDQDILINLPISSTEFEYHWFSLNTFELISTLKFEFITGLLDEVTITVSGMYCGAYADTTRVIENESFHSNPELSVTRLNINLVFGHAGTGNDGSNVFYNFVFNNAIVGKKSSMAFPFVSFIKITEQVIGQITSRWAPCIN